MKVNVIANLASQGNIVILASMAIMDVIVPCVIVMKQAAHYNHVGRKMENVLAVLDIKDKNAMIVKIHIICINLVSLQIVHMSILGKCLLPKMFVWKLFIFRVSHQYVDKFGLNFEN